MIGFSRLITASVVAPRRSRSSCLSLRRIFLSASLLGLVSTFVPLAPLYRRILKDRKSNPSSMWTILVLSWLKESPLGFSQVLSFSRTVSACSRLWHRATKSSA